MTRPWQCADCGAQGAVRSCDCETDVIVRDGESRLKKERPIGEPPPYRMTTPQMVALLRFHANASRVAGDPDKRLVPVSLLRLAADRMERLEAKPVPSSRNQRLHQWARSTKYAVEICSACGIPKRKGGRNYGCEGKPQGEKSAARVAAVIRDELAERPSPERIERLRKINAASMP